MVKFGTSESLTLPNIAILLAIIRYMRVLINSLSNYFNFAI